MGRQYGFYIRADRCVQCHACELACKTAHKIDPGVRWRDVMDVWQGEFPDIANRSISFSCAHCEKPACVAACPEGALSKRREDGIVVIDGEKCTGCRTCFSSCPFKVPRYGKDGAMQKCDMCLDRVQQGREPVCTATCPGEALKFGVMDDLIRESSLRSAFRLSASTRPSFLVSGGWTSEGIMKLFR